MNWLIWGQCLSPGCWFISLRTAAAAAVVSPFLLLLLFLHAVEKLFFFFFSPVQTHLSHSVSQSVSQSVTRRAGSRYRIVHVGGTWQPIWSLYGSICRTLFSSYSNCIWSILESIGTCAYIDRIEWDTTYTCMPHWRNHLYYPGLNLELLPAAVGFCFIIRPYYTQFCFSASSIDRAAAAAFHLSPSYVRAYEAHMHV